MKKPDAVTEVEAAAEDTLQQAWARLEADGQGITEDELPLLVEGARADRARWLIKQRSKGKDTV